MRLLKKVKFFPRLDDMRLRNKFLMLYICCVFIPIILTNVIFYNVISNNVREQRMDDIDISLQQVQNQFWMQIEAAVSVSYIFYTDINLYTLLDEQHNNPADFVEAYDNYMRRMINSYTPVYTSVQNIKIYVNNPMVIHSGGIAYLSDNIREKLWFRALDQRTSSEPFFIRSPREDSIHSGRMEEKSDSFSILRVMDYYDSYSTWDKVLKIELKTDSIATTLSSLNVPGFTYLVDPEGIIQFTNDTEINWISESISIDKLSNNNDMYMFENDSFDADPLLGWRLVALVPKSEILHEVQTSRHFVLWIAVVNIMVASSIIIIISRSITTRLGFILKYMKRVKNQHFDVITKRESRDEIGQLTSEFNRMTLQIGSLINDVYVADIKEKDMELEQRYAQLNALQSQINPHFLFNALETIRMRSIMKKENETAKIILNMAKLFRSSLTWRRDKVSLKEEVEFISCFLEIQHYRFADRLEYNINVDSAAEKCVVPKLIYLPFVENACIHGIEKVKNGGKVNISIEVLNDELHFNINDNGAGMSDEQRMKIYSYLTENADLGERIGVQNVIYRLKLIYGKQFHFEINSTNGIGTSIHIILPAEFK
ncbi:MAG: sensor histidine kinase [Candidatus Pristimantibacillus lignocellulolyticus]|uniref:Sensor histidine kinase n=1 Tax=Candidatus Pristimantibacillus lignocellulolyticus TaxID=2994561 RepID=A0A9J6ZH01_9BACL|nr:MAG: sensor histidine kinase [Candidatus Pristimantibacillus lignocellulolyticus]